MLPAGLRMALVKLYRPGQEIDKKPSDAYVDKAVEIHHWCVEKNKSITGNRFIAP